MERRYESLSQTMVEIMREARIDSIDISQVLRIPTEYGENLIAIGHAFQGTDLDFVQKSSFYHANSELLTEAATLYDLLHNREYSKQIEEERFTTAAYNKPSIDGTASEDETVRLNPDELLKILKSYTALIV